MVDDGIGIAGGTEANTALRYAANGTAFDGKGNRIGNPFFTGNGGNVFRSTDAEVDDSIFGQFQGTAATDDFLGTHGKGFLSSAFRSPMFAA